MSQMETHVCPECGIEYAFPQRFGIARRADGKSFFCPNGHSLSYRESENDRIRQERDRLKQRLAYQDDEISRLQGQADTALRSAAARKGVITRMKNRAAAGVCPCCSRSFENLRRHMAGQHPGYVAEEVA